MTISSILFAEEDRAQLWKFKDFKVENCGMNVSLFLLGWFQRPFDVKEVQNSLGVGSRWRQPVSLLQIKRLMEKTGLFVEAYQGASLDDVLGGLDGRKVCLLHTQVSNVGHFYLVIARRQDNVLVVEAGRTHRWISVENFKDRYEKQFSGYCLFVSKISERKLVGESLPRSGTKPK